MRILPKVLFFCSKCFHPWPCSLRRTQQSWEDIPKLEQGILQKSPWRDHIHSTARYLSHSRISWFFQDPHQCKYSWRSWEDLFYLLIPLIYYIFFSYLKILWYNSWFYFWYPLTAIVPFAFSWRFLYLFISQYHMNLCFWWYFQHYLYYKLKECNSTSQWKSLIKLLQLLLLKYRRIQQLA